MLPGVEAGEDAEWLWSMMLRPCEETNTWYSKQTRRICITFVQRWTNVEDAGPTLYKCYTNVHLANRYAQSYWEWNECLNIKVCKRLVSN